MTQSHKFTPTPVFLANQRAYNEGWPVICNEGGSRSGKTFSIVQLLIIIALSTPGIRISIVSRSLPHMKRGAYRDFVSIMKGWGIWHNPSFSISDFIYTFPNGSYIELFGLEDPDKAHGPGRDILFINEANQIKKALYDQLAMRTTGQIFLDWNPADFINWVYTEADKATNKRILSTYRNNRTNISKSQIAKIEGYKELPDDFMWKVYGLGERGASKEIIYTNWKICDRLPGKGDVFYGLDFGFVHPMALTKVEHYEGANYAEQIVHESGLLNSGLIEKMETAGVSKTDPIYADAAEPDSIQEIYNAGYNIHKANKDVWAGIMKVKSYPLFICNKSTKLKGEASSYKWKLDKDDNIIEEPVKANDDGLDAMRYGIHSHLTLVPWPTDYDIDF